MKTFKDFFQKTYVINLDNRPDRWESIHNQLTGYGFQNIERISACRPKISKIKPEQYSDLNYGSDHWEDGTFDSYLRGSMGCLQSHIKVLKTAQQAGVSNYLVFEDDALLTPDSQQSLNDSISDLLSQPSWDMFYLGGNHRSRKKRKAITDRLDRIPCTYTTHAYSVNSAFFDTLHTLLQSCRSEIDHFYAEKVHPRHDVFCCNPRVAYQSDSESDIAGLSKKSKAPKLKDKLTRWLKK